MKSIKITIIGLTACVLMIAPVWAAGFKDVSSSHWAEESVEKLADKKIMLGYPDGSFRGDTSVSRYDLAAAISRVLESMAGPAGIGLPGDTGLLAELLSGSLASDTIKLREKTAELETEFLDAREAVERLQDRELSEAADGFGKITITGDIWIMIDTLTFDNDLAPDDIGTLHRIGLNFSAPVDENISTSFRLVNNEHGDLYGAGSASDYLSGQVLGGGTPLAGSDLEIELAYIDVRQFFRLGDLSLGRRNLALGHSQVLDDKIDGIIFKKTVDRIDLTLAGADSPGAQAENGFDLNIISVNYGFGDHSAEIYYLISSTVGAVPADQTIGGISLDGRITEKIDYLFELNRFDRSVAGLTAGNLWLTGLSCDLDGNTSVSMTYGEGDDEFQPISIYYYQRFNDMFGRLPATGGADGAATGSLRGVKDFLVKLDHDLGKETDGYLIYETATTNDTDGLSSNNSPDYTRMTLGLDYQYRPNTVFGVRFDQVDYDDDTVGAAANTGSWHRFRIEATMKF